MEGRKGSGERESTLLMQARRRLKAEGIKYADEADAVESLGKCVMGIALIKAYKSDRGRQAND